MLQMPEPFFFYKKICISYHKTDTYRELSYTFFPRLIAYNKCRLYSTKGMLYKPPPLIFQVFFVRVCVFEQFPPICDRKAV